MPSQEEYLDSLLKGISGEPQEAEEVHGGISADFSAELMAAAMEEEEDTSELAEKDAYNVEDTANMSVEDIERILAESSGQAEQPASGAGEKVSLESLLQEAEEASLRDIQAMLHKSDNNEPVDDDIIALLEQARDQNAEIEWSDVGDESMDAPVKSASSGKKKSFAERLKEKREAKAAAKKQKEEEKKKSAREKAEQKKKDNGKEDTEKKRRGRKAEEPQADTMDEEMMDLFTGMDALGFEEPEENGAIEDAGGYGAGEAEPGYEEDPAGSSEKDSDVTAGLVEPGMEEELAGIREKGSDIPAGLVEPGMEEELAGIREKGSDIPAGLVDPGMEEELAGIREKGSEMPADLMDPGMEELAGIREKGADSEGTGGIDTGDDGDLFGGFDALGEVGELEGIDLSELTGETVEDAGNSGKKAGKKAGKEAGKEGKKKGLLGKILDFLTEEDEEEEADADGLILSDENAAILKDLDKEKGKKSKKGGKKGKKADKDAEGDGEEAPAKKEKKEKKPKKKKEPKLKEVEEPGKKLSKRRVFLIFLVCFTIGAVLLVLGTVTIDFTDKKKAAKAFYEQDYEACYQNLAGKNLNESQKIMYGKSESILRIRLWMREYELLSEQGQEPEALDSLMQSVHDYPVLYAYSGQWNAVSEVQEVYGQMLMILQDKYGLSEEQAKMIANEKDDLLYSRMVRSIAAGKAFGDWEEQAQEEETVLEPQVDLDVLPEEEELKDTVFQD